VHGFVRGDADSLLLAPPPPVGDVPEGVLEVFERFDVVASDFFDDVEVFQHVEGLHVRLGVYVGDAYDFFPEVGVLEVLEDGYGFGGADVFVAEERLGDDLEDHGPEGAPLVGVPLAVALGDAVVDFDGGSFDLEEPAPPEAHVRVGGQPHDELGVVHVDHGFPFVARGVVEESVVVQFDVFDAGDDVSLLDVFDFGLDGVDDGAVAVEGVFFLVGVGEGHAFEAPPREFPEGFVGPLLEVVEDGCGWDAEGDALCFVERGRGDGDDFVFDDDGSSGVAGVEGQ